MDKKKNWLTYPDEGLKEPVRSFEDSFNGFVEVLKKHFAK